MTLLLSIHKNIQLSREKLSKEIIIDLVRDDITSCQYERSALENDYNTAVSERSDYFIELQECKAALKKYSCEFGNGISQFENDENFHSRSSCCCSSSSSSSSLSGRIDRAGVCSSGLSNARNDDSIIYNLRMFATNCFNRGVIETVLGSMSSIFGSNANNGINICDNFRNSADSIKAMRKLRKFRDLTAAKDPDTRVKLIRDLSLIFHPDRCKFGESAIIKLNQFR